MVGDERVGVSVVSVSEVYGMKDRWISLAGYSCSEYRVEY